MSEDNSYVKTIKENKTKDKVSLSLDIRMRILANLMIDRIMEDYKNGQLKYVPESSNLIMEHKK